MPTSAELSERIIYAWQQAARDLRIEFITPWHLVTDDFRRLDYLGLVPHFGGKKGTLIRLLTLGEITVYDVYDENYHIAKLSESHARYDTLLFRGTLLRWGWTGPEHLRPAWVPLPRTSNGEAPAPPA